jgi:hypothetical protein
MPARHAAAAGDRMRRTLLSLVAAGLLAACAPNELLRDEVAVCEVGASDYHAEHCRRFSLERHHVQVPQENGPTKDSSFLLGFVEFDDQGKPRQRQQMDTLFDQLDALRSNEGLCLIIFVHGWKHNARHDDTNLIAFRQLLAQMTVTEVNGLPGTLGIPRKVVGIYPGWRGLSADLSQIDRNLSFWARKNAAHRVAEGSIRELFARARLLRDADRAQGRPTRMLTIGHSFGGLIVYTAVAQYLVDHAALASDTKELQVPAYGDLVIVINPAIEAIKFEPAAQIMRSRTRYARNQTPTFINVTSQADWATGYVFPIGRWFNTVFESFTDRAEAQEAQTAFGHYEPYWTHRLTSRPGLAEAKPLTRVQLEQECRDAAAFNAGRVDGHLIAGWRRDNYTSGAVLEHIDRRGNSTGSPYWVVTTDETVIAGHNDIEAPIFVDFVRQLYDDFIRLKEPQPCGVAPR